MLFSFRSEGMTLSASRSRRRFPLLSTTTNLDWAFSASAPITKKLSSLSCAMSDSFNPRSSFEYLRSSPLYLNNAKYWPLE